MRKQLRNLYLFLRSLLYRGNKVYCPCCNIGFRKFLMGVSGQSNIQCPRCRSLGRHRLFWLFLLEEKYLSIFFNIKMLHIAPEFCLYVNFEKMPNIEYNSIDLKSPYAQTEMSITDLEYPDNYFDAIICSHVLEHVRRETKAIGEIYRVLKPGGWAIIDIPIDNYLEVTKEIFPTKLGHVRKYGKDFLKRFRQVGFKVVENDFIKRFNTKQIKIMSLPHKKIYIYLKDE